MNSALDKNVMFTVKMFGDWKICMQLHLSVLDYEMWDITKGPLQVMKVNTTFILYPNAPPYITNKPKMEWTLEDKTKNNLDNIMKVIILK